MAPRAKGLIVLILFDFFYHSEKILKNLRMPFNLCREDGNISTLKLFNVHWHKKNNNKN